MTKKGLKDLIIRGVLGSIVFAGVFVAVSYFFPPSNPYAEGREYENKLQYISAQEDIPENALRSIRAYNEAFKRNPEARKDLLRVFGQLSKFTGKGALAALTAVNREHLVTLDDATAEYLSLLPNKSMAQDLGPDQNFSFSAPQNFLDNAAALYNLSTAFNLPDRVKWGDVYARILIAGASETEYYNRDNPKGNYGKGKFVTAYEVYAQLHDLRQQEVAKRIADSIQQFQNIERLFQCLEWYKKSGLTPDQAGVVMTDRARRSADSLRTDGKCQAAQKIYEWLGDVNAAALMRSC